MSSSDQTRANTFFVVIEGIDGSGKGTQAARLQQALESQSVSVGLLSFPRYEATTFGRAIGEFLNGKFGSLDEVHPQLAALLFAGDRFESRPLLEAQLAERDVVICDRYVASNVAHQAAKLDGAERQDLIGWIESIEFETYQLPRPDLTLLLDLPATAAQRLIAHKSARTYTDRAADLQEADADYLERVRQVYLELADRDDAWRCISIERHGDFRPVEEIAGEILAIVREALSRR